MTDNTTPSYGQCILVLDNGFVFYTDSAALAETGMWQTGRARCIRRWGTANGLGELSRGPTPKTELDAAVDTMEIAPRALLFVIPCAGNWG